MNVSKDLIAASATPLILAILKENDSYGYAIIKRVKEMSKNELVWTEGMLYPVLHRLEEQLFIESYWNKSDAGRQRKYYRINERGFIELELQKKQWEIVHSALSSTWNDANQE
jgi:PadR family transcriptional regulator, regulatory protein PadR